MSTRTKPAPKIRIRWENESTQPRVKLERKVRGRTRERSAGPRGRLTLEEAAAVLGGRPVGYVRRAIRTGFLRACPDRRHLTLAACRQFLLEEREDGKHALAALDRVRRGEARLIPYEDVQRELGLA